ncbi:MAG: M23 family metallopeptidase [Thermodesulfobacteriota bacterium]
MPTMSDRHMLLKTFLLAVSLCLIGGCANPFVAPRGYAAPDQNPVRPDGGPVVMPAHAPSITQGFAPEPQADVQNAVHEGIDIYAAMGTPVIAPADGVVIRSYGEPFYGNHIVIDHGTDDRGRSIRTVYWHLDGRLVNKNDSVIRGQLIGALGRSGLLGLLPHLHFEVRVGTDKEGFTPVNPHLFWADGPGVVTCFDPARHYAPEMFCITYPVVCPDPRTTADDERNRP